MLCCGFGKQAFSCGMASVAPFQFRDHSTKQSHPAPTPAGVALFPHNINEGRLAASWEVTACICGKGRHATDPKKEFTNTMQLS